MGRENSLRKRGEACGKEHHVVDDLCDSADSLGARACQFLHAGWVYSPALAGRFGGLGDRDYSGAAACDIATRQYELFAGKFRSNVET